jgi:hypothetical protein
MKKRLAWPLLVFLFLTPFAAALQPVEPAPSPTPTSEVVQLEVPSGSAENVTNLEAPPMPGNLTWQTISVNYITALQVVLIPMLVAWLRTNVLARIPRIWVIPVGIALGVTADLITTALLQGDFDPLRGALTGALGTVVRELASTWDQHGLTGK